MKKIVLLLIILAVLGFGGWSAYQRIKSAQSPSGFRPASAVPVEIVEIRKDTIKDIGIFTGSLNARSQFTAAPKVSGWLRELLVDVGDTVTRNQVIAVLDDAEYTQQVDQAQAELNVAQARHTRAVLNKSQMLKAFDNLVQLAQIDVRTAYIEVTSDREQITATTATRTLQEEKLRVENEKFSVGRSTSLFVAQAQRDLVESQIAEVQAIITYFKALVSLYELEGSLLQRRGIEAPGSQPFTLDN